MIQSFDQLLKSHGYGFDGDHVVDELRKALATTTGGIGGTASGPLMLENLDALMTEVLITERHFKLFNFLRKVPSAQPYYEYNRHSGYGQRRGNLGFAQGGGPTGSVSAFVRNGIYTKFLGVQGGVTHQMLTSGRMGGTFEDPQTRENRDRALELFSRLERELVFGMSSIKDSDGVEVNMDGLLTDMSTNAAANVIDLEGAPFSFDHMDDSAVNLVTQGKMPAVDTFTVFQSAHVAAGINQQYGDRNVVRHNKDGAVGSRFAPGFKLEKYDTQFGTFNLDYSILLEEVEDSAPVAAAHADAPDAPATVTGVGGAEATSKMVAGTYYYSVGAFNDSGESLVTTSEGVAVTSGQKATLTIARVTGAAGYRIYRGLESDGSDAKWIGRATQPTNGNITFVDLNGWRTANATTGAAENGLAIFLEPDPTDVCIALLAPLLRMPLPQVRTTFPFYLLLYCVLVLKARERIRIYKNCGVYTTP